MPDTGLPVNREALGNTGIYARYGSASVLAAKIADLLLDHGARFSFARRVRDKAVQEHSWNARGKTLAKTYQSLVGSA